ncbi:MAG: ParB/RepB/Spo0J family partition protein [Methylacidiphilales bacterium]|nr:ParB/RepB/Spo0J family partition protein [Candidatus Methylacidiphilales bacterium]MDW8348880.1 ParB/RepB/Spo0J family partition protein [Verrucomicrobiae bacterium]
MSSKPALGRGLKALIGTAPAIASPEPVIEKGERVQNVQIERIVSSPFQPRKVFREEELTELKDSIKAVGILQPLIVRAQQDKYELIAGERRWRAAQALGLKEVPVIVRSATDREVLEFALTENLQRADLDPIEEAQAYVQLIEQFGLTQEEIAQRVGKNRATIANNIRLLSLSQEVITYIREGKLSVGHAKVLLSLDEQAKQDLLARRVIKENITVRQLEKLVAQISSSSSSSPRNHKIKIDEAQNKAVHYQLRDIQTRLQQHFATKVTVHGNLECGKIEIAYYSSADLDRLHRLLLPHEQT